MKKNILELSYKQARDFLMDSMAYCTISLPPYIDFTNILTFVRKTIGSKDKGAIIKDNIKPSECENVNYTLLVNKDGHYAYRPLQISNPFLYYLLVKEITKPTNWDHIINRFRAFKSPNIIVASIPSPRSKKNTTLAGESIMRWWEDIEQESIKLALEYKYIFITDITDCYGSIYTHTIAWSLHGEDVAKTHKGNGLIGNYIDSYLRDMHYAQTNGIPQGSVLYDFIAEMVLGYADSLLSQKLTALRTDHNCPYDYKILRYRDDYRIFCNSKEDIEEIGKQLQQVLFHLNFKINSSKTILSEEIVLSAIKPDKLYHIRCAPVLRHQKGHKFATIQQELLYILQLAREYPNSGTVLKLLTALSKDIFPKSKSSMGIKENKNVLISIVVEIAMICPKAYAIIMLLISYFVCDMQDGEKIQILSNVYTKFKRLPNTGELEIWLQRLTYPFAPNHLYQEQIAQVVKGDNIELWNNTWIKPEFLKDFKCSLICDRKKLKYASSIIGLTEVSVFEYNQR